MTEKLPKIAAKGPTMINVELNKKYAWCSCGLSQKEPFCDGRHKLHLTKENKPIMKPKIVDFNSEKLVAFCSCKQTKNPPFCDGSHNDI